MPQVDLDVRRERAARLREAAARRKAAWLRGLVGSTQDILVEAPGDRGHSANFAEFRLDQNHNVGEIVRVTITNDHLSGLPA
jgi:threonylcarbamoyladenosine tRNA methylthiotransferase MtaB